jgi:hypothetical protein
MVSTQETYRKIGLWDKSFVSRLPSIGKRLQWVSLKLWQVSRLVPADEVAMENLSG